MSVNITADAATLMHQAPDTVDLYLGRACGSIDDRFGDGYAKAHPQLVAAFIQACAMDFGTAVLASALQDIADSLHREGVSDD